MDMAQKRIAWIDVARGLGILFIILGHIPESGHVRQYLFSFHVPLFFMISGMCYRLEDRFSDFLKNKMKTIIIPYMCFSIISIFVFWTVGILVPSITDGNNTSLVDNIIIMLYGNSKPSLMKYNLPLWFLPCFFCASIIVFFIEKSIKRFNKCKMRLIAMAFLACVGGIYSRYWSEIGLPWHFETAISMSVFFLIGIQIKDTNYAALTYLEGRKKKLAAAIILLIVGGYLSTINRVIGVRNDNYGNLVIYYIAAICGCWGWIEIAKIIDTSRLFEYVGRNTMIILGIHKFPIMFITKVLKQIAHVDLFTIDTVPLFILALVITFFVAGMLMMFSAVIMRFAPIIIGREKPSR